MLEPHETILAAVFEERDRVMSRRGLLGHSLRLAAGGALALGLAGAPVFDRLTALAQSFTGNIDVLNYALTLEHLEYAFYRDGIGKFQFGNGPFGHSIDTDLAAIRDHEQAHVATLTKVITQLGGTPVKEATYNFGYGSDPKKFLATAQALENTGVRAYDGAGASLKSTDLLTAAGTIVAVEARHASYLNLLNGQIPFPAPFEQPATRAEVLTIAGPFIVSSGTPAAGA